MGNSTGTSAEREGEATPVVAPPHGPADPELLELVESLAEQASGLRRRYEELSGLVDQLAAHAATEGDAYLEEDEDDPLVWDEGELEPEGPYGDYVEEHAVEEDAVEEDAVEYGEEQGSDDTLERERVRGRRRGGRRRGMFRRRAA